MELEDLDAKAAGDRGGGEGGVGAQAAGNRDGGESGVGAQASGNRGGAEGGVGGQEAGNRGGGEGNVGAQAAGNRGGGVTRGLVMMTLLSSLSGFYIGYDQGVIAGCMILIREELHITLMWHQIIVGGIYIMGTVTTLFAGLVTERFGRWIAIVMASLIYIVGAVIMATSRSVIQLLVSRLITGISIGMNTMAVPVYMSESSPTRLRGRIITVFSFMIAFAQIIGSLVGAGFTMVPHGWRYMIGMGTIPALIQFIGFFFLPESPRWLVMKGKIKEARKALKFLRTPKDNWEAELNEIKATAASNVNKRGIVLILKTPPILRALYIGSLLHVAQTFSGAMAILGYSVTFLIKAGIYNKTTALLFWSAIMGVGGVGFLFGLWLVEKVGRRPLVLASVLGVTLGLLMVAVIFHMIHIHGPAIQIPSTDPQCQADTCGVCTSRIQCGLCYTGQVGNEQNTSCVAVDPKSHYKASLSGPCSNKQLLEDGVVIFASGWCPYENARILLVGFAFFFFVYTLGIAGLAWTINGEIFPGWARSTATSITSAVNWIMNMIIVLSFLSLSEAIFTHGVFYLLMSTNVVLFLMFLFLLPETKGITLENVENLFNEPLGTGILIHPRANTVNPS